MLAFSAALALAPAAQVRATAWLVSEAQTGGRVVPALVLLAVLVAVGQVLAQATNMQRQRVRLRLRRHFQDVLLRAVGRLSPRELADPATTSLIQNGRESTFNLGELVGSTIGAIGSLVTAALLCWSVWSISPVAGILVVLVLLPTLAAAAWEAKVQDSLFDSYGHWGARSEYAVEQVVKQRTGMELISLGAAGKVAGLADRHRAAADVHMDRLLRLTVRADSISALITAVLLGGALFAIEGRDSSGAGIAAGVVGVLAGMAATRDAGFAFGDIVAYAPKVSRFRRLVPDLGVGLPPEESSTGPGHQQAVESLSATGVTVSYPQGKHGALVDFNLEVRRGEMIALVGANGAGKSTAVNAIVGLVEMQSGRISIDGDDLAKRELPARLGTFSMLSQDFGRYEFTVREVVGLGTASRAVTDDDIWLALERARAATFVRALPEGLDTQLGEQFSGTGLSGGQWQRLALARIHLRDAPIWILDEPTSTIDSETEQEIFQELGEFRANRITIVVSHRAWTLRPMDRIYVIDGGRVVEEGNFETLVAGGGRFTQLFSEQLAS